MRKVVRAISLLVLVSWGLLAPGVLFAEVDCLRLSGAEANPCPQNQAPTTAPTSNTSPGSAAIQSQNYTEYRLLAPLPFIGNTLSLQNGARQDSFANYVNSLYRLLVLVGSVLAVVFFAIGGFLYMTGEALDTKEAGRSRMRGAVLGLLLLLAPYIILNAINPDLLKLSLVIPGVSYRTPTPVTTSGYRYGATAEEHSAADAAGRKIIDAGTLSADRQSLIQSDCVSYGGQLVVTGTSYSCSVDKTSSVITTKNGCKLGQILVDTIDNSTGQTTGSTCQNR